MKLATFGSSLAGALLLAPALLTAQPQTPPQGQPGPGPDGRRPGMGRMMNQGGEPGARPMMKRERRDIKAELGLTDVQQADLRKARETAAKDALRKRTDLRVAHMELRSLLRAEKVDDKAVAAKLAEVQAAQGALTKIRVDQALAMKRILTPEQQKKFAELRGDRRHGRMSALRQRRGFGAGGQGRRMGRPGHGPQGGPGRGDEADDVLEGDIR